jgi:predicted ATPase
MLMDMFYATLPPNIKRKTRVHFHAFMIDVHKRLHAYKLAHPAAADPILPIARELAKESTVICFDEFQVTDIAYAMILRRLLECLLRFGVVFVMTSKYVSLSLEPIILTDTIISVVAIPHCYTKTEFNVPVLSQLSISS